jgi:hypothetical protein
MYPINTATKVVGKIKQWRDCHANNGPIFISNTTSRVQLRKKFLLTSCGLPADFPDFTSFA